MDLDLLLLFNIRTFLDIWLNNWLLFLHFSHFVVVVVAGLLKHLHLFINMDTFPFTFSDNWFQLLLLLLHIVMVMVVVYLQLLELYV